jgi:hypothetical protein
MDQKKKININPEAFNISSRTRNKKQSRKKKHNVEHKISPIKKNLLQKIKHLKQRNKHNEKHGEKRVHSENSYVSEFNQSMDFLTNLSKTELAKNPMKINVQLPANMGPNAGPNAGPNDPPYGVLKRGNKPTYREWKRNKTMKNHSDNRGHQASPTVVNPNIASPTVVNPNIASPTVVNPNIASPTVVSPNIASPTVVSPNIASPTVVSDAPAPFTIAPFTVAAPKDKYEMHKERLQRKISNDSPQIKTKQNIKIHSYTKKYGLGKKGNVIGVLLKNNKTRKKINSEKYSLKKKSILEIKEYLRNHNLIKIGSLAPNEIIRSIYEAAMLSGNIKNKNDDVLMYNFTH